jgi:hypothetical protein
MYFRYIGLNISVNEIDSPLLAFDTIPTDKPIVVPTLRYGIQIVKIQSKRLTRIGPMFLMPIAIPSLMVPIISIFFISDINVLLINNTAIPVI